MDNYGTMNVEQRKAFIQGMLEAAGIAEQNLQSGVANIIKLVATVMEKTSQEAPREASKALPVKSGTRARPLGEDAVSDFLKLNGFKRQDLPVWFSERVVRCLAKNGVLVSARSLWVMKQYETLNEFRGVLAEDLRVFPNCGAGTLSNLQDIQRYCLSDYVAEDKYIAEDKT